MTRDNLQDRIQELVHEYLIETGINPTTITRRVQKELALLDVSIDYLIGEVEYSINPSEGEAMDKLMDEVKAMKKEK